MTREEMYKRVVSMKNFINEFMNGSEWYPSNVLFDYAEMACRRLARTSYNDAVAFATVLVTGTFVESANGNMQFMMPSTHDCMGKFKEVKKYFSKTGRVRLTVEPDYE